jgi:ATP-binding cassette subfamily C exporter for protease/lipase
VFNASFESLLRGSQQNPNEAFVQLNHLRQFLTGNGIFAFFDAPWTPIYIFVVFILHPWLGYLAIVFGLIQVALAIWSNRSSKGSTLKQTEAESKTRAFLQSKLKNAEPVEAMGMLGSLRQRWWALFQHQQTITSASNRQSNKQQAVVKTIRYSMQSLTLGAAALLVVDNQISAGAMIAANVLMSRALQPLDLIVGSWKGFLAAKESFQKLEKLLLDYPDRASVLDDAAVTGLIEVDQLSALTPDKKIEIIKSISAKFLPGQVTCVIGPSGSGKSTFARCLVGIWPDIKGQVKLDNTSINDWDRQKLGPHIGYLPQDVELFEGTIAENIARFYEVDAEQVILAAKKAGIHEMILRFPKGYDTPIGEGGGFLSGGQRQRVALARAMYGNPQIIVLDEPNANLDDSGEKALAMAVQTMKSEGKTVFLVTHRMNILSVADQLLVMDEGTIRLFGPRDEVIKQLEQSKVSK